MIILRNVHTNIEYEYDDEIGKQLLVNNKFDFELVNGTEEIKEEIKELEIPTDEALITGKKKPVKRKK